MNIYEWLKSKQVVVTPSGFTYEVEKFKEAVIYIEDLHKERDMYKNGAAEANARLDRQRDLYEYGGGKHLSSIKQEISEINKNIQEVSRLLTQLINALNDSNGKQI